MSPTIAEKIRDLSPFERSEVYTHTVSIQLTDDPSTSRSSKRGGSSKKSQKEIEVEEENQRQKKKRRQQWILNGLLFVCFLLIALLVTFLCLYGVMNHKREILLKSLERELEKSALRRICRFWNKSHPNACSGECWSGWSQSLSLLRHHCPSLQTQQLQCTKFQCPLAWTQWARIENDSCLMTRTRTLFWERLQDRERNDTTILLPVHPSGELVQIKRTFCEVSQSTVIPQAEELSLTAENVLALEDFLQSISDDLKNFTKGKIPTDYFLPKTDFLTAGGHCSNLNLLEYDPFNVTLEWLTGQRFELRIQNGLVEGEGKCIPCTTSDRPCWRLGPLTTRIAGLNFQTTINLTTENGGKPILQLSEDCHLDLNLTLVRREGNEMRGIRDVLDIGETALEEFGCQHLHRALTNASQILADFLS